MDNIEPLSGDQIMHLQGQRHTLYQELLGWCETSKYEADLKERLLEFCADLTHVQFAAAFTPLLGTSPPRPTALIGMMHQEAINFQKLANCFPGNVGSTVKVSIAEIEEE